jgi:hypothetical protein
MLPLKKSRPEEAERRFVSLPSGGIFHNRLVLAKSPLEWLTYEKDLFGKVSK